MRPGFRREARVCPWIQSHIHAHGGYFGTPGSKRMMRGGSSL